METFFPLSVLFLFRSLRRRSHISSVTWYSYCCFFVRDRNENISVIKYVATATTPCETVKNTTRFVGLQRFQKIKHRRLNLSTLLLSFLYITLHNMVSVGFFSLELNIHTLWHSHHIRQNVRNIILRILVFTYTLISVRKKTFIGPRGFKQAQNLDKTSSSIKHGIRNSTTSRNGNGRLSTRKLGHFQSNMGELCGRHGYWKKSSKRTGRHTSFSNRQGISANIQKPANIGKGTSRHTKILERLTNNIEPKENITYQWHMFNSCKQELGKNFDAYLIKLRHLIKMCEYSALEDEQLRDRIVTSTSNNNVRARLLGESGLTLNRAIDICKRTELAEQQLGKLNNSAETIHYTKADKKKGTRIHKRL